MANVSKQVEVALLSALQRIRSGQPLRGTLALDRANIAIEAGVSRASAYRCEALADALGGGSDSVGNVAGKKPKSSERELRHALKQLLNRIVYLECLLQERDQIINAQRRQLMRVKI